jgi:transcriptional regulator with XRE-family HTH domain
MQTIDDLTGTLRHIGDMLRDWRQRRHLSQRALANAAGVSPRAVSELEAGRRLPNLGAILRLTERLEIPLRDRNAMPPFQLGHRAIRRWRGYGRW